MHPRLWSWFMATQGEQGEGFARALPDARFVLLGGVGHWPMLTAPERFEAVALEWLRDVATD